MDERNTLSTTNKVHAPSSENILLIKWQQSLYNAHTHTHTHFCTKATHLGVRIRLMKTMRHGSINVSVCVCVLL